MSEHKFTHFLTFNDLPLIGTIEVSEPFGFDGSTLSIEQEKGKHSRNLIIMNSNNKLEINRKHFERLENSQILPNGVIFDYASQGFDYLLNEINERGWELSVDYTIKKNGIDFKTGQIDGLTYEIKKDVILIDITQNSLFKDIKANEDINIDAFNNKDLEGNTILPCETNNIFLKAKPLLQKSIVESRGINEFFQDSATPGQAVLIMNMGRNILQSGIKSTLTPFESQTYIDGSNASDPRIIHFKVLKLKTNATNVKIKHYANMTYNIGQFSSLNGPSVVALYLVYGLESQFSISNSNPKRIILYNDTSPAGTIKTVNLNQTFEYNIPEMSNEECIWLMWYITGVADTFVNGVVSDMSNEVELTSTAVSTVVKGVRLHDLLNHQARSLGTTLIDNVFLQPEYYNNFVMNGRMIGNFDDLPFNNKFKETYPTFCDEAFADYQIENETIVIKPILDFYKDAELLRFDEVPNITNNEQPNINYAIKQVDLSFKKSSSDRTVNEEGTIDDVHTSLQLNYPTNKPDGKLDISFDHIRSAYLIEEQRRKANEVDKKTKTLENDENLFAIDCIDLPAGFRNNFGATLIFRINNANDTLELLSSGSFNWQNLGLVVGQQINVSSSVFSSDLYQVLELTPFIIKLQFLNYLPTSDLNGTSSFTFDYLLSGVQYTNRTNEGFSLIEGVENSENYSNLKFSLKRILNKWSPILSNASQFLRNKYLVVTEIKTNNKLITKLSNESIEVIDFEPIPTNDIVNDKFLNGKIYNYKVFADFENMLILFESLKSQSGYLRINTMNNEVVKGFVNKAEYLIKSNELNLTLFGKYENNIIEITDYLAQIDNFKIVNNFLSVFDADSKLLFNIKELSNFSINGIVYENEIEFSEVLINLLN